MDRTNLTEPRPLGAPKSPRRRFVAPTAVRLAQLCMGARIAAVVALILSGGLIAPPTALRLPGAENVTLPGGALWNALALWVIAGSVVEAVLVLRLGTLRTGSRRVVLLVESVVIAASGMYAAAGFRAALAPLVAAVASVVLLRLDHVRHSFNRARAERALVGRHIPAVLFSGYELPDPRAVKHRQQVGYRIGIDCPRVGEEDMTATYG